MTESRREVKDFLIVIYCKHQLLKLLEKMLKL